MKKHLAIVWILILVCTKVQAQTNMLINQGNKLYEQKKYKEAAEDYQRALQKSPTNVPGIFNLGNTLYQQGQFDGARQVLDAATKVASNKTDKANAHYNIGNTYMQEKKWEDAINAYKNTLRNNPQDVDAKYNLSYAEEMLKKQQQQGGGKNNQQNKDQQKKQDKNQQDKNKQDQQKKDQQQQQQQQNNKDQQKKEDQNQQPQSQPSKLSQQQADQLLNALQQEEKKLQDKKQKQKGIPVQLQKDW